MIEKLISSKIAKPYAESFFAIGKKNDILIELTEDVFFLLDVDYGKLKPFFKNPVISQEKKLELVEKTFKQYLNKNTFNLINTLVVRKRAQYLQEVLKKFLEFIYKEYDIQVVDIYSAAFIIPQEQKLIEEQLRQIKTSKRFKFNLHIQEDLIGGFKIEMGSQLIDLTIKYQLRKLARVLTSPLSL